MSETAKAALFSAGMSSSTTAGRSDHGPRRPRRFAPLDPDAENKHGAPRLKGIVFDVDGTLCLPQNYMFREMRDALDIPRSVDILEHIKSLSDVPDLPTKDDITDATKTTSSSSPRSRAVTTIQAIERRAMTSQRPQPGLQELMTYLREREVKKALCTRNFHVPVQHLLDTFLPGEVFWPVITRETDGVSHKPSPEGIWKAAESWGLLAETAEEGVKYVEGSGGGRVDYLRIARRTGEGLIMVGDSVDDMAAGWRAGAATVLLLNEENQWLREHEYTDLAVGKLDQLTDVLERGFEGRV